MRSFLSMSLGVGLAALGAGCFSERVTDGTSAITPDVQCNIPLSVIDSGNVIIAIRNFTFAPDSVAVRPGQAVTWVNCEGDGTLHTATSDGGTWDSGDIVPGAHFSYKFPIATSPAEFTYHCTPHPSMVAKVVLQ